MNNVHAYMECCILVGKDASTFDSLKSQYSVASLRRRECLFSGEFHNFNKAGTQLLNHKYIPRVTKYTTGGLEL